MPLSNGTFNKGGTVKERKQGGNPRTVNGVFAFDKAFNDGIDPKLFFDVHNKVFAFDLWWYYDGSYAN